MYAERTLPSPQGKNIGVIMAAYALPTGDMLIPGFGGGLAVVLDVRREYLSVHLPGILECWIDPICD
jgi:hypothetical protein